MPKALSSSRFSTPAPLFLWALSALAACGHEIILFHLLDPAEMTLSFEKAVTFRDMESGRILFIDPVTARKNYLRKLEDHNESVQKACSRLGISYRRLTTDRPLELALFEFMQERMQRGKFIKRRVN